MKDWTIYMLFGTLFLGIFSLIVWDTLDQSKTRAENHIRRLEECHVLCDTHKGCHDIVYLKGKTAANWAVCKDHTQVLVR